MQSLSDVNESPTAQRKLTFCRVFVVDFTVDQKRSGYTNKDSVSFLL